MRLENAFTVPAPVERAWAALLDMERVAPCLPGAALDGGDGTEFSGSMTVKLGPVTSRYRGTVRIEHADAAARHAVLRAQASDARAGRHRHPARRPRGAVRSRRDAGRVGQVDAAVRRLPRAGAGRRRRGRHGTGLGARRGRHDDRDRVRGDARGAAPARASGRRRARRGGGGCRGPPRPGGPRAALGGRARPRGRVARRDRQARRARRDRAGCRRCDRHLARPAPMSRVASVAVLCDIHGNLPALDAVVAELEEEPPDAIVIGGDSAAGPMPVEVLARLHALPWPAHWLRGNADRFVVMGYDGTIPAELLEQPLFAADAWTATFLSRADRDFLDGLPQLLRLTVDGLGQVLFCHATARSDEERVTVFTPEERLARILAEADAPLVVAGHTHRQFDRAAGG